MRSKIRIEICAWTKVFAAALSAETLLQGGTEEVKANLPEAGRLGRSRRYTNLIVSLSGEFEGGNLQCLQLIGERQSLCTLNVAPHGSDSGSVRRRPGKEKIQETL